MIPFSRPHPISINQKDLMRFNELIRGIKLFSDRNLILRIDKNLHTHRKYKCVIFNRNRDR